MSLNRTLGRLFDEIRREAKRNPAFADRLDAVLRAHASARDVPEAVLEEAARAEAPPPPAIDLNPVALFTRDGAEALAAALDALPDAALAHLVGEHNLDPAGTAEGLARPDLVAHIVAQARKRVERDSKLFDY
jgi:hypothetical protein